jgi:hypothetical protein
VSDAIRFTSRIELKHRPALERLLFFNACQSRFASAIVDTIDKYGLPEILTEGDCLRVTLPGLPEVQSLFALDCDTGQVIGVAIYVRADLKHITILHIGLSEECCAGGDREGLNLLLRLIKEIRRSSRRVKGISGLRVLYRAQRLQI